MSKAESKWKMVRLGDVCEINMGQSPASSTYNQNKEGMVFFQGNADFGDVSPTIRYYCTQPTRIAKVNDLLLSVRAPIGALNIANIECCIGRGLCAIRPRKEIKLKYLYYILKQRNGELNSRGTGSTFKAINKQTLLALLIPLPSIETQEKIALTLDTISDLIKLYKQQLEQLDLLVKSQFVEMFGDPKINPKRWEETRLGAYLEVLTDYHSNGSYESLRDNVTLFDIPNYALMIRTTDLEKNNFEDDVKYINEHAYNHLEKSKVFGGEIIINKIGSAGKVYLMPDLNRPVSLAMNQFLLRFNKDILDNVFVYHLLNTPYCESRIKDRVRGAVTKTITKDAIREVEIYVPPIQLQNLFAEFAQQIEKLKSEIQNSLKQAQDLFDSQMQTYFG